MAIPYGLQCLAPRILVLALMAGGSSGAFAAELLADFQPSDRESPHGLVSRVRFSSGLVDLRADALIQSPKGTRKVFRFDEPVWLIGYKSEIVDAEGNAPRENYLCHTFFGDENVVQRQDQRVRAIYSDGFTRDVQLPDGFGLPFTPYDDLQWFPLFNNRGDSPTKVGMRIEVNVIREKDLKKPLQRVYSTLVSVQMPHLFYVPPGRHEQQKVLELPFGGKIHFLGTHVHPHGKSVELFNVSRQEGVWKGNMKGKGGDAHMEVYSSADGYTVRPGETYRVTSVYDNQTTEKIDAMAAVFMFYTVE